MPNKPDNKTILPEDIFSKNGEPLTERDLSHVWIGSKKLNRRVDGFEMLNIQASLVKPIYDEVSDELDLLNEAVRLETLGTERWNRLDKTRSQKRGFYNICKQVWAIRKKEYEEFKKQNL